MQKRNPYEPIEPAEQLAIDSKKKEISAQIEAVSKLASECLADAKFLKYRTEFERMRSDVFNKLDQPIDPDPIRDAHYLRTCINTILILDKLLEKPEKDLRKP